MAVQHSPSAFPRVCGFSEVEGMTLREYYVGQTIIGILSNPKNDTASMNDIAKWSIMIANQVMKELGKY